MWGVVYQGYHAMDLGNKNAVPVPKPEYDRLGEQTLDDARKAKA